MTEHKIFDDRPDAIGFHAILDPTLKREHDANATVTAGQNTTPTRDYSYYWGTYGECPNGFPQCKDK